MKALVGVFNKEHNIVKIAEKFPWHLYYIKELKKLFLNNQLKLILNLTVWNNFHNGETIFSSKFWIQSRLWYQYLFVINAVVNSSLGLRTQYKYKHNNIKTWMNFIKVWIFTYSEISKFFQFQWQFEFLSILNFASE